MKKICPEWLKSAVFYEIYPSSFFDSNGDGIGDLPGIIAKLDYLTDLGVNALWLNPCFASTFADGGYDISDYRQVAPRYGSNDDLVRLFREAEKRNIKICLDLVAGHTSTEHQWFKESAKAEKNATEAIQCASSIFPAPRFLETRLPAPIPSIKPTA